MQYKKGHFCYHFFNIYIYMIYIIYSKIELKNNPLRKLAFSQKKYDIQIR